MIKHTRCFAQVGGRDWHACEHSDPGLRGLLGGPGLHLPGQVQIQRGQNYFGYNDFISHYC